MMDLNLHKDREMIQREFKQPEWMAETGLPLERLTEDCRKIWDEPNQTVPHKRARILAYLLDNAQVTVHPYECFADQLNCGVILQDLTMANYRQELEGQQELLLPSDAAEKHYALTGEQDFGHTCPDWNSLLTLGYPGLLERLRSARAKASQEQVVFYDNSIVVYEAVLRYVGRLAAAARSLHTPRMDAMADDLHALQTGAPQTLHQALHMTNLTFFIQQMMEGVIVRSLGRFDVLMAPFYQRDLASGRCTRAEAKELLQYYYCRWNAREITANIPITLCGNHAGDKELVSSFASLMIEAYGELDVISPKFHIRCSPETDPALVQQVLKLIRAGSNSFVFCNDAQVKTAMQKIGQSEEDAQNYVMVGCYEPTAMGHEVACTCSGRISLPKVVEYTLTGGVDMMSGQQIMPATHPDFASWDDFLLGVKEQLRTFSRLCMERINVFESLYATAFSSPFFSGSMQDCVEKGIDAYAGGMKYNNTSVNAFGLATAVDALAAIRQMVFEDHLVTLPQMTALLKSNWQGAEKLRLMCQKRTPKYGVGDARTDSLARELMDTFTDVVNGKPNQRGGLFHAGSFSIDWRMFFGEITAASADGRYAGEPLSKNLSASVGQDTQGVTGLIHSCTGLDFTNLPNGAVLDIVLHESAVTGQEGLAAMTGLVETFMRKHGLSIQCNVLDADTLRRAQKNPEQYPTLQVRLCGWNVRFVDLDRREQDDLICQAEGA